MILVTLTLSITWEIHHRILHICQRLLWKNSWSWLASAPLRDLNTSMDFTILADEITDDGDQSQLAIFVHIIGSDHRPIEHFLGITCIAISKTAAIIMDIISNFLISKEMQPYYIRFCGLDGTNSMSSEHCCLQHLIKHSSSHAEYINCCNHQLALCFFHLLKEFPSLVSLDASLFIWRNVVTLQTAHGNFLILLSDCFTNLY